LPAGFSRTGFSLSGLDCHASIKNADRLKPVLRKYATILAVA
jgi:hypothetical protein